MQRAASVRVSSSSSTLSSRSVPSAVKHWHGGVITSTCTCGSIVSAAARASSSIVPHRSPHASACTCRGAFFFSAAKAKSQGQLPPVTKSNATAKKSTPEKRLPYTRPDLCSSPAIRSACVGTRRAASTCTPLPTVAANVAGLRSLRRRSTGYRGCHVGSPMA